MVTTRTYLLRKDSALFKVQMMCASPHVEYLPWKEQHDELACIGFHVGIGMNDELVAHPDMFGRHHVRPGRPLDIICAVLEHNVPVRMRIWRYEGTDRDPDRQIPLRVRMVRLGDEIGTFIVS